MKPTPEAPLRGGCGCRAVRFEIRGPLGPARYCHCHRCQHRTGTAASPSVRVERADFELTSGAELINSWEPEGGLAKAFCSRCGSALFAGSLDGDFVSVRLGAIEGDPDVRPSSHQWVSSAAPWEPIPDDGLPRFEGAAP